MFLYNSIYFVWTAIPIRHAPKNRFERIQHAENDAVDKCSKVECWSSINYRDYALVKVAVWLLLDVLIVYLPDYKDFWFDDIKHFLNGILWILLQ